MRLQFLPLALCLLFVFYGKNCVAFSVDKTPIEHSKTPDFKGLPNNTNVSFLSKNLTDGFIGDIPLSIASQSVTKEVPLAVENLAFFKNEEFSYNSNDIVIGGMTEFSKNKLGSFVPVKENLAMTFRNGMFYGFVIMLLLLNVVCYLLFSEKLYLKYSLALAGIISTFIFNDGIYTYFGVSEAQNPEIIVSLFLLVTVAFSSRFVSKYLTVNELYPKFRWGTYSLILGAGGFLTMAFVTENSAYATYANLISFTILVSYFSIGVILFSVKNYAKFYVIASFIPLLFSIDFFVLKNLGFEFLATETVHLKSAMLVESLLLTYAIMYRMKSIKEESQMRQTELRIFLKRQEVMNRKNAMKLMEDVYLENLIMHYDLDGLEIKLLQYISEGKENAKIAKKLKTTEVEIEELTKELYHKLEISEHIREDIRMVDNQPDYIYN